MADLRVSLRSVNKLLKTFDSLIMELEDMSAILKISINIEQHNVHNNLNKYTNKLNKREHHLKNKEKECMELKTRKAKDITDLLKNQDSLIKLTGARTHLFWLQGLKR